MRPGSLVVLLGQETAFPLLGRGIRLDFLGIELPTLLFEKRTNAAADLLQLFGQRLFELLRLGEFPREGFRGLVGPLFFGACLRERT